MQWNYTVIKTTIHSTRVACFLCNNWLWKTCHRVVRTSIWSILYSGELCNKNCIVKTSHMLIDWRAFCYTAVSDKSDAVEGVPDQLLKGAAMMLRVPSRHVELLLTYWCSQSTMIVNFEATVCNNNNNYYYYYKRWLLRWRKIRRLQGHLTVSRRSQFRQTSA